MWQSPWDNAVPGGDQVAAGDLGARDRRAVRHRPRPRRHALSAGRPHRSRPRGGRRGARRVRACSLVAVLYALLAWRGFRIAGSASNDYGFFLGTVLTLFLIVPVLVMAAGILGVTPLTGVVTPFLSYGGSAMVANFAALGMLCRDPRRSPPGGRSRRPFARRCDGSGRARAHRRWCFLPWRSTSRSCMPTTTSSAAPRRSGRRRTALRIQPARARSRPAAAARHDLRPHAAPAGDRRSGVIADARQAYQRLGVSLDDACPMPGERCYPLGGARLSSARRRADARELERAQHVVRRARRGKPSCAASTITPTVVQTTDRPAGRSMLTIRRDYRDLVPLLRHRYEPAIRRGAAIQQPHDVHLTIDAGLQLRVAAIVASYAQKSAGKAAAVVLDPDTGELLASVSYPWPDARHASGRRSRRPRDRKARPIRCSIARATASIRRDRRSSW